MALTISFNYDPVRDAYNLWQSMNCRFDSPLTHLWPTQNIENLAGSDWEHVKGPLIAMHEEFKHNNRQFISAVLLAVQSYWASARKQIIECLDHIFIDSPVEEMFTAFLTLCSRCPYNPQEASFMISFLASPSQAVYTVSHEIFHLLTYDRLAETIANCPPHMRDEFCEMLTCVLDTEMTSMVWLPPDRRESVHQIPMGKMVVSLWNTTKDIDITSKETLKVFMARNPNAPVDE